MLSVIVPVYNAEKDLDRCVNSILNQTYRDIEVILVDDGSPDNSPCICDGFSHKDSRVRVIHKENGGVSTARNAGLDAAQGDYIAFVDSDDFIEPDMYEKMMNIAEKYSCDVVMCDCIKDFGKHSEIYTHNIKEGFYDLKKLKDEYYNHLLIMENIEYPATISNVTILWKSTLNKKEMRYQPGVRFSEDLLFGAKLLRRAESFYYMKNVALYHYVMNPQSASHTYVKDKWKDYLLLHSRIKAEFENDKEFDFSRQIDLCLLFFIYNTVGEIYGAEISKQEKLSKIKEVLQSSAVQEMFKRVKISSLKVPSKLKVLTFLYKHQLCLNILLEYFGRK